MPLPKPSLQLSLTSVMVLGLLTMHASGQTGSSAAERCASFNTLSERHGDSAREITAKAQEQAKALPAADAEKFLAANEAGAKSEWEMSALARDAYRKCMQDYLSGGTAAAPQAPAAAVPAQPQAVQQTPRAVQKPAQQVRSKQARQKPRAQQTQRVQQERPAPQQTYQPILPGLINLGIGIGLGGIRP